MVGADNAARRGTEYAVGRPVPGTPYIVERLLDQGGQSLVYEVRNGIGKHFVLKVVRPTALGEEFSRRLEDEARILVRLEHPNIVAAHELGLTAEDPPRVFMVMERLRGRNLRALLDRRTRVDIAVALQIGASVADALAHTHAAGVVHLDVKPANVFVHIDATGVPVVKLLDFGFMRALQPGSSVLSLAGTPTYGAPEQLLGEPVSPGTDIYSLGLVLYELLSGRRPFPLNDGVMAVVTARLSRQAPLLSRWILVPSDVEQLVMSCIERQPSLRPDKAESVARALWDAHGRALRRRRGGGPYDTAESLVGLVRETGAPHRSSGPHSLSTQPRPEFAGTPPPGTIDPIVTSASSSGSPPARGGGSRRGRTVVVAGIAILVAGASGWIVAQRARSGTRDVTVVTGSTALVPARSANDPPASSAFLASGVEEQILSSQDAAAVAAKDAASGTAQRPDPSE